MMRFCFRNDDTNSYSNEIERLNLLVIHGKKDTRTY